MEHIKVGYLGSSYRIAEDIYFSKDYKLEKIIVEKNRINKEILLFSELYNVELLIIKSIEEIQELLNSKLKEIEHYIMYNFGLRITEPIIDKKSIYNIHPGNLSINRGRNPIERSIMDNEKTAQICIYKISEKLDLGLLIHSEEINISLNDDSNIIRNKLEDKIPILLYQLSIFLKKEIKGVVISEGLYLAKINQSDYTINLGKDSLVEIYNKIRSQKNYNGAILYVKGEKYRVITISEIEINDKVNNNASQIEIQNDNNKIIVFKGKYKIFLEVVKESQPIGG